MLALHTFAPPDFRSKGSPAPGATERSGGRDGPRGSGWKAFKWIYASCIVLLCSTIIIQLRKSGRTKSGETDKNSICSSRARSTFSAPPSSYCFPIAKQMPLRAHWPRGGRDVVRWRRWRRHAFDWIWTENDMMWSRNWFKEFRSIDFARLPATNSSVLDPGNRRSVKHLMDLFHFHQEPF